MKLQVVCVNGLKVDMDIRAWEVKDGVLEVSTMEVGGRAFFPLRNVCFWRVK